MQKKSEIGSEYWLESNVTNSQDDKESFIGHSYLLSGRTAIDVIIQDIINERQISVVYMPAWGCDSMIFPFLNHGIKVVLYDVVLDVDGLHYDIDDNTECDIFYVNNYFGYNDNVSNSIIERLKKKGTIILYDKTHSFLMQEDITDNISDYTFTSIRKWMGVIAGAVVYKKNGKLLDLQLSDYPYLACKFEAMKEKAAFIGGDLSIDKQNFLNKYVEFAHHLVKDYRNYRMDALSLSIFRNFDLKQLREERRINAQILHDGLNLQFINNLEDNVCPLFVPVFFESKVQRDNVRKALVAESVYCPVHWSKNCLVDDNMKVNDILERELSLICDQRYNEEHMQRIIEIIKTNI